MQGRTSSTTLSRWVRRVVAVVTVAAVGAPWARGEVAAGTGSTTPASNPRPAPVPSFVGLTLAQARLRARSVGGRVDVELWAPTSRPKGEVVSQAPTGWPVGLVVSSGPWTTPRARLAGERADPVGSECAVVVHVEADGNVTPLLCGPHLVNVGAWLFYSRGRPALLALPRASSRREIVAALCDATPREGATSALTVPERLSDYALARAYNGWKTPLAGTLGPVLAAHPDGASCVRAGASVGA